MKNILFFVLADIVLIYIVAVGKMEGVNNIKVDIPTKTFQINYDPQQVSVDNIEEVLDDVGYTVVK